MIALNEGCLWLRYAPVFVWRKGIIYFSFWVPIKGYIRFYKLFGDHPRLKMHEKYNSD